MGVAEREGDGIQFIVKEGRVGVGPVASRAGVVDRGAVGDGDPVRRPDPLVAFERRLLSRRRHWVATFCVPRTASSASLSWLALPGSAVKTVSACCWSGSTSVWP